MDQSKAAEVEDGVTLCLSGGGYRAMLFHVGVLRRLCEVGVLAELKRVSSVSGGSITAGCLAIAWTDLQRANFSLSVFEAKVASPIKRVAAVTIDVPAVVSSLLLPWRSSSKFVADRYDALLFEGATLQDLPNDEAQTCPRFVFNATNVQTKALWRFSRPYMGDYRTGLVLSPHLRLADAVAASSAFPPFLSPYVLDTRKLQFETDTFADLQKPPFTTKVMLTDGGVYDNLGLETLWKRYKTILVSDAGAETTTDEKPSSNWLGHTYRVLHLLDHQIGALRFRQIRDGFATGDRRGAYWSMRFLGEIGNDPQLAAVANTPTRLKKLSVHQSDALIELGYRCCSAGMQSFDPSSASCVQQQCHSEEPLVKEPLT